jgi:hypothetical protein
MISGFSVLSLALDAQTDIVNTQRVVSDIEIKKQQERFGIAVSTDTDNLLEISVSNLGQNPVELSSFWIINKTLSTEPATRYSINYADSIVTGSSIGKILATQPLYMVPDTYDVKIVSSLGTIEIAELEVGLSGSSSNSLRAVLITDPPDVILGQNVTIAMIVTNTGTLIVNDVTPSVPSVTPPGAEIASSPPNLSSVDLIPGESILFSWDYTIDGTANAPVGFSNFATGMDVNNNIVQSNTVFDTSILRVAGDGEPGESELIVLTQDLLSRPEIFMIIPSPMGDGTAVPDKALWGSNIVNPTNHTMFVNKVVISLLSPRANNNDIMFGVSGTHTCAPDTIPPTPDKWSCPEANQLMWEDLVNPVEIPPFSVFPFLALVHSDRLASGEDELSAVIVHGNVFTTVGQFGKAGYGTSFDNGGTSMASVFLSKDVDSANLNDILSNQTRIDSGSIVTFNVTLADFESGAHKIDEDSRLIINIPKGWSVDEPSISSSYFTIGSFEEFGDTSSQIIGILDNDLTSGGVTIQFDATAPTVENDQMYVMYLLADGTTDDFGVGSDFTIGPLQEAVLQVIPPP